jgi:hypothetical protein
MNYRTGNDDGASKKKIDIASLFEDKDAAEPAGIFKNTPSQVNQVVK